MNFFKIKQSRCNCSQWKGFEKSSRWNHGVYESEQLWHCRGRRNHYLSWIDSTKYESGILSCLLYSIGYGVLGFGAPNSISTFRYVSGLPCSSVEGWNCPIYPRFGVSLVLSCLAVIPGIGEPNWFFLVALSPYAGIYYWQSGDRVDDCQVKLSTNDEETENEIAIQGSDEELERMWRTLGLQEKGMVKVEGILES